MGLSISSLRSSILSAAAAGMFISDSSGADLHSESTDRLPSPHPLTCGTNVAELKAPGLQLHMFDGIGGTVLLKTNGVITGPLFHEWRSWADAGNKSADEKLVKCFELIKKHWGAYNTNVSEQLKTARAAAESVADDLVEIERLYPKKLQPFVHTFMSANEHSNSLLFASMPGITEDDSSTLMPIRNHLRRLGYTYVGYDAIHEYAERYKTMRAQAGEIEASVARLAVVRLPNETEIVDLDLIGRDTLICRGLAPEAHYMFSFAYMRSYLVIGELTDARKLRESITGHAFVYIPEIRTVFDPTADTIDEAIQRVVGIEREGTSLITRPRGKAGDDWRLADSDVATSRYTFLHAFEIFDGKISRPLIERLLAPVLAYREE